MAALKVQASLDEATFASARSALLSVFDEITGAQPASAPTVDIASHCVLTYRKRLVRLTGEVQQVSDQVTATLAYRTLAVESAGGAAAGAGCLAGMGLVVWSFLAPLFAMAAVPIACSFLVTGAVAYWFYTAGYLWLAVALSAVISAFFFAFLLLRWYWRRGKRRQLERYLQMLETRAKSLATGG